MADLRCSRCDKKLTKKRARVIDGKVLCSPCMFAGPVVTCPDCGKPKGYSGFRGAECMCGVKNGHAADGAHSVQAFPPCPRCHVHPCECERPR